MFNNTNKNGSLALVSLMSAAYSQTKNYDDWISELVTIILNNISYT